MGLTWSDSLALGVPVIDEDHRVSVEQMADMAAAADDGLATLFDAFAQHMREHFAREEAIMDACHFPARDCHAGEHQRVLGILTDLKDSIARGETGPIRAFAETTGPNWFVNHRNTMDSVTLDYARAAGWRG
ncbi:MAG: hemerythrin domain-containing protein [Rhodospirillales bacterium]|nr:hemerythrin domain-containing protein [Rhodospirillales bacterium]